MTSSTMSMNGKSTTATIVAKSEIFDDITDSRSDEIEKATATVAGGVRAIKKTTATVKKSTGKMPVMVVKVINRRHLKELSQV